jgi:hypothetical protein
MTIRETLNDHDVKHRTEFAEYATHHAASDWHREVLDRLYEFWVSINRDHFKGACVKPHILLAEPKTPRALGDHAPVSGWGSKNQIRIRPTLIDGEHKDLKPGPQFAEGRMRFVEDLVLHESVHQYCEEALHDDEKSYKGHGPIFAGQCNRIGEALGLPPVRPAKARGKLKDLPSCAQWPQNVRPADYYLGALADPPPEKPADDEGDDELPQMFPCPFDPEKAIPIIAANIGAAGIATLIRGLGRLAEAEIERRKGRQDGISSPPVETKEATQPAAVPPEPPPEPKDAPRTKPSRRVSVNGDIKGAIPKRPRGVSANGDKDAVPKRRKNVSDSRDKRPGNISTNRDNGVFAVGDRVRFTGKVKPRHATTGVVEDMHDYRDPRHGDRPWMEYKVRWDDGATNWKTVVVGKVGPIEAIS